MTIFRNNERYKQGYCKNKKDHYKSGLFQNVYCSKIYSVTNNQASGASVCLIFNNASLASSRVAKLAYDT